jgi:hypothetical protein
VSYWEAMPGTPSILGRTHVLDGGPPVRLRLARRSDEGAVGALLAARGLSAAALDVRRLLAFDPLERLVLCALAPIDGAETLVGIGAIDLAADAEIDALVVDERRNPGLGELLGSVLSAQAQARARRVA